jgi:hypothetical protein
MKASATAKTIASIAACLLAGALQCGPTDPVGAGSTTSGGNGGGGGTGTSPTAGAGGDSTGDNPGGGNTGIVSAPPPAGGSTDDSSDAAVAVPASPDANCGIQTENPTPQPVDLLLVLDRSASMSYDIASETSCSGGAAATCTGRWSTITTALNQVLAATPASVQWGLKFFPSPGGGSCTVKPGADVSVGPNTAAQIQPAITGTGPGSTGTQTPTTAAIQEAVVYFNTANDGLTHYMLLATDGLPNCDPGTSSAVTDASVMDTAGAIGTAFQTSGIKTYVIGIGPSTGNLDNFAQAGGTGTYFPATSPDDLTTALGTIVVDVTSCRFTMNAAPPDPSNLGVYLDKDTKVPLDPSVGYSLGADNVTVTFNGSYCDGLKNGTYQVVQVFFGCPGSPPPQNIP